MVSIKFLFIFALAIACVFAMPAPEEVTRAKKQVLLGGYPYAYSAYTAPLAAAPVAYSAGYAAYPYGVGAYYY